MGRELRIVPPNWEHPKDTRDNYKPLEENYDEVASEWLKNCIAYSKGEYEHQKKYDTSECKYYWEYAGPPPEKDMYVSYKKTDCSWFQLYENVSEGSPITPPFETKDELIQFLITHGDFWGNNWSENSAKLVVDSGGAPSMIVSPEKGIQSPHEQGD